MQTPYLFWKEIPYDFMSRNGLDFGSGLSVQEGLTFSMHSVRGTRLGVGQKVQILVILILA
jgi:hypothetical protein